MIFDRIPWRLTYEDTFDREEGPQIEMKGKGLKKGLFHLWKKVLSEGIDDEGKRTFSKFSLWAPPEKLKSVIPQGLPSPEGDLRSVAGDEKNAEPNFPTIEVNLHGPNPNLLKLKKIIQKDKKILKTLAKNHLKTLDNKKAISLTLK